MINNKEAYMKKKDPKKPVKNNKTDKTSLSKRECVYGCVSELCDYHPDDPTPHPPQQTGWLYLSSATKVTPHQPAPAFKSACFLHSMTSVFGCFGLVSFLQP